MSADNWAECPKCAAKHITEYAELQQGIIDEYGKITPGDYLELVEKSKQPLIMCNSSKIFGYALLQLNAKHLPLG